MQQANQQSDVIGLPIDTIIAFDFGTKRIGVAIGNNQIKSARPLITIDSEKTKHRFIAITKLIETWQPQLFIVGHPTHVDGSEQELTRLSLRFARRLRGRFRIKTVLIDERYTTCAASELLREAGIYGIKQKPMLDQLAAQQILQSFFDDPQMAITLPDE